MREAKDKRLCEGRVRCPASGELSAETPIPVQAYNEHGNFHCTLCASPDGTKRTMKVAVFDRRGLMIIGGRHVI